MSPAPFSSTAHFSSQFDRRYEIQLLQPLTLVYNTLPSSGFEPATLGRLKQLYLDLDGTGYALPRRST